MSLRQQLMVGGMVILAAAIYCAYITTFGVHIVDSKPVMVPYSGKLRDDRPNPLPKASIGTVEDLAAYAEQHAPPRLKKEIRGLARSCIRGDTRKVDMSAVAPGASRIGGVPDLPKSVPWPRRQGKPMAFIAQIDLASIAALDPESLLPHEGFLCFFYDSVDQPWGFRPGDKDGWAVLHHVVPATELVRTPVPVGLEKEARFSPAVPLFGAGASFPSGDTFYIKRLALTTAEDQRFDDLWERISETFPAGGHQILGYAQEIQSAMEAECELASNGVDCGGMGPPNPRAVALRPGESKWILLLQIDSDDNTGMMWGDVGRLYVWIRREDLKKRDFSKVWVILQCT